MKINFRQGLAVAVSSLLLFSSAGAWAVCDEELKNLNIAANIVGDKSRGMSPERHANFVKNGFFRKDNYTSGVTITSATRDEENAVANLRRAGYENSEDREKRVSFAGSLYALCMLRGELSGSIGGGARYTDVTELSQRQNNNSLNQQQSQQQAQSIANFARAAQQSGRLKDRPDLLCFDCDVGTGAEVKNGASVTMHFVYCIVGNGSNTCSTNSFGAGSLAPGRSQQVITPPADYLVAACKAPARPYNVSYQASKGVTASCGEF